MWINLGTVESGTAKDKTRSDGYRNTMQTDFQTWQELLYVARAPRSRGVVSLSGNDAGNVDIVGTCYH
jgi:hypothetical protein